MSRADAAPRILDAAIELGTRDGVGALALQGIAQASGVSKALVLYHYGDKDALLLAVAERLVERDVAALHAAAGPDALERWRDVAGDRARRDERALLASLLHEAALRHHATRLTAARIRACVVLAEAVFVAARLRSRVASPLVGRFVVQLLDGLALDLREREADAIEAELDVAALALLGLGRE